MQSNSLLVRFYNFLKKRKIVFIYIPLVIYWIGIFIATTIPTDALPQLFSAQDKLEHFAAYGILASLIFLTLHVQEKNKLLSKYGFAFTMLFLALYGAVDELHQLLVPGRYCDVLDWTADISGGLICLLILWAFVKKAEVISN